MGERIRLDMSGFCHGHHLDEWLKLIKELLITGGWIDIPGSNDTTLTWYPADSKENGFHMPEVQDYDDKNWKWYILKMKEPFEYKNLDYMICARVMYPSDDGKPDYPAWYCLRSHDLIKDEAVLKWAELEGV